MNKIRFAANRDTNYVFHMLSAAKCGYDNAYGARVRKLYPAGDLNVLWYNEALLTVCGGAHCGELYGLMVCEPACGKVSAKDYYQDLMKAAEENKLAEGFAPYAEVIKAVCGVMVKHYDHYAEAIWSREKEKLESYIQQLKPLFEETGFTGKAEELVGCKLPGECFTATLVTSVQDGAEAIDISKEQDVFGIERSCQDAACFIGHEFIIYLLFEALRQENAFRSFATWELTEGLAEYYLEKLMGTAGFGGGPQKYAEFYARCAEGSRLSAVQLYRMALAQLDASL